MAQRKSLLEEIREQNTGANFNQRVVDNSRKFIEVGDSGINKGAAWTEEGRTQRRTSLLQDIVDSDGIDNLNQDYVNRALDFDGGFGALSGGYIKGDDGRVYMHDYSQNADFWRQQRAAQEDMRQDSSAPSSEGPTQTEKKSLWDRIKGFFTKDRAKNVAEAAITGTAAGYTAADRALYEAGQSGRSARNKQDLQEYGEELERAKRDLAQALELAGGNTNDKDVISAQNTVNSWQQKYDAMYKVVYGEVQQQAAEETKSLTHDLEARTQKATEAAKAGTGKVGKFAVDAAINMLQMGGDALAGIATGSNNLIPMAYRVFGQGTSEAEKAGANLAQQLGYGATSAGIEVFTEKLFDGVAGIYGAGEADKITAKLIRKLANTPAGRTAVRTILSMGEEGLEEVISDILSPAAMTIYNGKNLRESYGENFDLADVAYDFLIGAAVSGGMNAVAVANPIPRMNAIVRNRAENAQLASVDKIEQAYRDQGVNAKEADTLAWATQRVLENDEMSRGERKAYNESPVAQQVTEQVRTERESAAEKVTGTGYVRQVVKDLGANEEAAAILMEGYQSGTASATEYAAGVRDAYKLGEMGLTLEQATRNAKQGAALNESQFRHAWSLGRGIQTAEENAVDASTAEGKEKLSASLASLGVHSEKAVEVYAAGQDSSRFAAAMSKAAALYAANGADLTAIYESAKSGKTSDIISYLSPAQIETAAQIGAEIRAENQAELKASSARYHELREQAAAAVAQDAVNTQALTNVNKALSEARKFGQQEQDAFKRGVAELDAMVSADSSAEGTDAYNKAYDEALEHRKNVEKMQAAVEELEAKRKELQERQPVKRKKGTVSFDGGQIDGKTVKGVDREKLSRQQKNVVAMVEALADAVNIDYVFFDGDAKGTQGAYIKGGTVYININSGMAANKALAAATLSHELTHYMQEYAPEEYQSLKDFIVQEILRKNPTQFDALVKQQLRLEPSLSYDGAVDEVIANACQTMLLDSKAVVQLARQNMNLAEKVADVIEDITAKIKAAFEEVNTSDNINLFKAVKAVDGELDRIRELWDKGLTAATENYNAERITGTEKAASEGGVKYSKAEQEEILHLKEQVKAYQDELNKMIPVATVNVPEGIDPFNTRAMVKWAQNMLKSFRIVDVPKFGKVKLEPKRIDRSFDYLPSNNNSKKQAALRRAQIAAYPAIPRVLKRGIQIQEHVRHKGNQHDTVTYAAPVVINGVRGNMAVVVTITTDNFYKVHRVLTTEGELLMMDKKIEAGSLPSGRPSKEGPVTPNMRAASEDSVTESQPEVKRQEWDSMSEEEKQAEINATMTMQQAKAMIEKAYVAGGIRDWYEEYRTADQWLKGEGASEVAMYIENEYELQRKYINSNPHLVDYDFTIEDVLESYLAGTLTGKVKKAAPRVDTSRSTGYQDSRFYAPRFGDGTMETWDLANTKSTKKNQAAVTEARKNILFAAHEEGLEKRLGITAAELNKKLRTWSRYSANARSLSMRINNGVAPENQWTGIQNSAILNGVSITDEDIRSMVKDIDGESSEYQRGFIGNAMLALDTHIDWSWLSFDFKRGNADPDRKSVRGFYNNGDRRITIGGSSVQNTVSHEMGHALDFQWERDLFGNRVGHNEVPLSQNALVDSLIPDDEGRIFYHNFRNFIDELMDVSDNYSNYTMEPTEIFARFVAKFVEWTQDTAGAYTYKDVYLGFSDKFTTKNYLDFAKLLQEKSAWDGKRSMSRSTQHQRWDAGEYEELTGGLTEEEVADVIISKTGELREWREKLQEMKSEFDERVDKVVKGGMTPDEFNSWQDESGYGTVFHEEQRLDKEIRMLRDRQDELITQRLEQEERKAIEKSGLSEEEYFAKQAVKEFGYTPYFYDAGYIMLNGKMLNFSGQKGRHFGSRGQDHRAIGTIFATSTMSDAMYRFLGYGNIRIIAEAPGLDISTEHEPTAEQYRTIRSFARENMDEDYFSVDLTDSRGNTVGTLEYEDKIRPDRIVNDIKHYYQTGEIREPSAFYQQWDEGEPVQQEISSTATAKASILKTASGRETRFQRWDNTTDDTAAEKNGRELAYTRLQAENAILNETVKSLRRLTGKQSRTIERLQERLHLTKTAEVRESDARRLAGQLLRENGSRADKAAVASELKVLGDYILQTPTAEIDEAELKAKARIIAAEILENAEDIFDTDTELYQEIRERIRGKKLTIRPEFLAELDAAGGFDDFRKRNFGKFTLAKSDSDGIIRSEYMTVEQFYTDISSEYPGVLPQPGDDTAKNEGDYIQILASMFDAGTPLTVNPFEDYMGEASEELANRIVFNALDGIMRPTAPTDADRAKNRREALQEQIRELKAQEKLDEKAEKDLVRTVYDLTLALDKADSKYKSLRAEAEYRTNQVREEGIARAAEVKAKERARAAEKIQSLKEHYQDITKRARERREESAGVTKYRSQVKKKAGKLYEMLMKNDDKLHVPEVLKGPLAEFLSEIDFSSKRLLSGGEETQNDKAFGANLMRLQQILSNQQDYINGTGEMKDDLGGYIDVSPDSLEFLRTTAELITKALGENRGYTINQMNATQLKDLSNFLSSISSAIRNMNSFMANARFESVREAADADISYMQELGKAGVSENSRAKRFAFWENGTPYYVFKRFGEGGKAIFEGFTKGWERMAFDAQEIIQFTKDLYTSAEVIDWKSKIHEITLSDGSKIQMTTAQIMELSMLLNREQALKHIEKGGIRIGDIETKGGTIEDIAHYHLTFSDIAQITGQLTERQQTVAKALQKFMAVKGAEWGNEISMRRFGYNFYTEGENYYPIRTDSNDRPMADTDAQMNSMFRLLNLSSSKALNPKASNALVVGNIFDTFADHMADMAKLHGMGLPILDAIKWFNYKERIDRGDGTYDTRTLQGAMQQAFGSKAQSYFRTLMKDINGLTESGDRGVSGFSGMLSRYKIAAVGANIRVALLQPTSYVRATTVINPLYLAGVAPSRAAYEEAMKYSGTAVWKSQGYYDTDIAKSMRGQIQHDDTIKDKIADASMTLAELGDKLTWSMLWTASKRQAKANNPGLSGDELCKAAADVFRECVYSSQVMDSTLTRSEIMRGKTHATKAASAFMAEPTLSYNILLDAYSEYQIEARRHGRAEAWQKCSGKIGKAFVVFTSSAAFAALMESFWDSVRDDDDNEFLDKFLEHFLGDGVMDSEKSLWERAKALYGGNFAQDMTILGKLPFVKNIISLMQGYGDSNMATEAAQRALDVFKILTGQGSKRITPWGKIYKILQPVSMALGIPFANFARDAVAIWDNTVAAIKPEWKLRKYDSIAMSADMMAAYEEYVAPAGIGKTEYKKILNAANTDGNTAVKQDELGAYLVAELEAGHITEEQAAAIWTSQWHAAKSKTFDQWRGRSSGSAASSTTVTPAKKETSKPAPAPTSKPSVSDYDIFKANAPIYSDHRQATFDVWESVLQPAGMSLDRFTTILSKADADGNGSLRQDELGYALRAAVHNGEMSYAQASAVWDAQGWKHNLDYWSGRH